MPLRLAVEGSADGAWTTAAPPATEPMRVPRAADPLRVSLAADPLRSRYSDMPNHPAYLVYVDGAGKLLIKLGLSLFAFPVAKTCRPREIELGGRYVTICESGGGKIRAEGAA